MSFWKNMLELLTFQPPQGQPFELVREQQADSGEAAAKGQEGEVRPGQGEKREQQEPEVSRLYSQGRSPNECRMKRLIRVSQWHSYGGKGTGGQGKDARVSANLQTNIECLKEIFHIPRNRDVIFREFSIGSRPPVAAVAIYIDGMTDRMLQNVSILEPLMLLATLRPDEGATPLETVIKHLLPGNQVETVEEIRDVVDGVLSGSTVILVDYSPKAIIVETKAGNTGG